jgi:protein TonB
MNSLGMNYDFQPRDPSRRWKGIVIVLLVHALIGYALVSGMARTGLNLLKKPLEAVVIQEVIIPPPPPPPPPKEIKQPDVKVDAPPPPFVPPPDVAPPTTSTAPVIQSTSVAPPPAPAVIAPPPPPAPPKPNRADIGVACPTQVAPEMPRKALQDGIQGVVKASALIVNGVVKEVIILSGPRVFHSAVRSAMMQYRCVNDGEITATQEFNFKVE